MEQSRLVYDLEVRVIDLEERADRLAEALNGDGQVGRELDRADLPEEVVVKIRAGSNPIKEIRKHRMFTQKQLSEICGVPATHISALEGGKGFGRKTAMKLAAALQVSMELILP